jgi:hypothetical protein
LKRTRRQSIPTRCCGVSIIEIDEYGNCTV